jgi:hypothetical protein
MYHDDIGEKYRAYRDKRRKRTSVLSQARKKRRN